MFNRYTMKKVNDWANYSVVSDSGNRIEFEMKPALIGGAWRSFGGRSSSLDFSHDTTDWEDSLIEFKTEYVHKFVNPKSKAFAVDLDGIGYEFMEYPKKDIKLNLWDSENGTPVLIVEHEYKGHWEDSLQINPDYIEEWDGEGIPPLNEKCIINTSIGEINCKVIFVGKEVVVVETFTGDELIYNLTSVSFSKLKSEKEELIDKAYEIIKDEDEYKELLNKLYEANMLK